MSCQQQSGLVFNGVTKKYGSVTAVDDVCLNIEEGEFLTLLGPSGSGKTTLLMMIAGFVDATSGTILLDDQSIGHTPPEKRDFGMVFQGYALFPHMTVRQNVGYSLSVRKRPATEINARVDEMLKLVQLQDFADRFPAQLSGGQQQRVALARALCFSPKILLLDEPLGALDKKLRVDVQEQLKAIHTQIGTTFVYVTHDQEEALSMSDRVVIMNHGAIVQVGSPQELYEKPNSVFSAGFLGKSNFLHIDDEIYALRPERIDIAPDSKGKGKPKAKGTIRSITYVGSTMSIHVHSETHGEIEVNIDSWRTKYKFNEGQQVGLTWAPNAAVQVMG